MREFTKQQKSGIIKTDENIESKLFPTPDVARGPSQDAINSAQAFIGGNGSSSSTQQGDESGKKAIVEWAKANGRLVSKIPWKLGGPRDKGEGEHHVFADASSGRWIKITKGTGTKFGITLDLRGPKWSIGRANVWQYLERLKTSNGIFGDDIRLHAVYQDKYGNVNLVTSQPDVKGASPSPGDIAKAMVDAGFIDLGSEAFYRAADNILALDLHDQNANIIDNEVIIFDASTLHPTPDQLSELRKQGVNVPDNAEPTFENTLYAGEVAPKVTPGQTRRKRG